MAHLVIQFQRLFDVLLAIGNRDTDMLQMGGKSSMTAVVRPVGIQYPQLRFRRLPTLLFEVADYLAKVVCIHRQSPFATDTCNLFVVHLREAGKAFHRTNGGIQVVRQTVEVFLTTFDRIDIVVAYGIHLLVCHRLIEEQQTAALNRYLGLRIDEVNAIHGRRSTLVKLPRKVLHGKITAVVQRHLIAHRIGYALAEYAVTALGKQLVRKAEQVIYIHQPQRLKT